MERTDYTRARQSMERHRLRLKVKQADADIGIPPHRERSPSVLVFSSASRNCADREAYDGCEPEFILKWRLPLIGSGRADCNGSTIERIEVTLMPGTIAKRICGACSIVGNRALVGHRDFTDGLPVAVLFLTYNVVGVVWVSSSSSSSVNVFT